MRTSLFFMVAIVITVGVGACSEKSEPGSCYRDKDNACTDYSAARSAAGKRLCSGMKWTAGAQSCPTANRVGTCVAKNGVADYLYGGAAPNNYSAAGAKSACEASGGVFTAAP